LSEFKVDFGAAGQAVTPGYHAFFGPGEGDGVTSLSETFEGVTVTLSGGGGPLWSRNRSYSDPSYDWVGVWDTNNDSSGQTLILTLSGLAEGEYSMGTNYYEYYESGYMEILVDGELKAPSFRVFPQVATTRAFSFTADGTSDVEIRFHETGHSPNNYNYALLNSFILRQTWAVTVPEPAGLGLIGLALLTLRRRRS